MSILLFGSTGMLGRYIFNYLNKKYDVKPITHLEYDIENDNFNIIINYVKKNLKENDIIINCSGIIPQKYDNNYLKKYIKVNTLFPHKLEQLSVDYKLKFIHITTDCVYDGIKGIYNENDTHNSYTLYGTTKSLGEPDKATIIRTSIIGEELNNKKSLMEWIISNKNKEINGYTNHYWNGVTCLTLAKIIYEIINKNLYWEGIRHIFSPEIISKYKLCCIINNLYNLNIKINPVNHNKNINLSLATLYPSLFNINNIEFQILEQKNFLVMSK
jgi:dTDP-4-dehydrorhamnose reductase